MHHNNMAALVHAEAHALLNLATLIKNNPVPYNQAVDIMQNALAEKGRIVVTGVGKSGHIAGKIAATLASTKTPAFFVDPTHARHGDLGMINENDVVIALSHSGESQELGDIITYAKRWGNPIIAITGKPHSTLGQAADVVLLNGVEKEACPLNLAPTSSTTASLALADGLAVALMMARGVTTHDFAKFHPGGKLGAQLLRVGDVMIADRMPLVPATAPMADVLAVMLDKPLGCVGVTDRTGTLVGNFSDGDFKRQLKIHPNLLAEKALAVMNTTPKTILQDVLAITGVRHMQDQHVKALWVIDDTLKPVGLFRMDECLASKVI